MSDTTLISYSHLLHNLLKCQRGKHPDCVFYPQTLLWFMTVFYVLVFLSGLLGNLSVIIVIVKSKGLHCAMNYYLISLAMADILIIILGKSKTIHDCKFYY